MATDFPESGDDQEILLRNSQYPQFDYDFALDIRENYRDIWTAGGMHYGNQAFENWGRVRSRSADDLTESDKEWIKKREGFMARHIDNHRLAGVVAVMKWGGIVSKGESYMKRLINEEKEKEKGMSKSPFIHVPFEVKAVKQDDDENYFIVEGYASVYGNVDLVDDIVMPGAFSEDLKERGSERPILWQHSPWEPIGSGDFREDSKGMPVTIKLPKTDDMVKGRVMPQIKVGSVKGLSIGYVPIEFDFTEQEGREVRRLKRCKLMETSLVTFPANEEALVSAAKQFLRQYEPKQKAVPQLKNADIAEDGTEWSGEQAEADAREQTGSQDEPSATYKNWFFWYDEDEPENFGSYKFPKLMMVDGEPKYVPRGLAAVVGALAGARGGADIPEDDADKIKQQLNRLYKRMGREEPFPKKDVVFLDRKTIKSMERLDIEHCIGSEGVVFSRGAKEYVAGVVAGKGEPDGDQGEGANILLQALKELEQTLQE